MKNYHIDLMGAGMRSILHFIRVLAVMLLMGFNAGGVGAQPYPSRHIELVSPTGAGGGSDLVARTVAEIVAREKLLPQQIIVQNRPGGGGAVGQTYVAGKRGDPYVFIQAAAGLISVPLRTGLDVGIEKFTPLGAIGLDLNSIAVAEGSPYRTLKDLLDAARAKPKSVSVGITFPGGSAHSMMYRSF